MQDSAQAVISSWGDALCISERKAPPKLELRNLRQTIQAAVLVGCLETRLPGLYLALLITLEHST